MSLEVGDARRATESQVGWNVCGINGCILMDRHPGQCVFPEVEGARRRRAVDLALDLDAPQHLSSRPASAKATSEGKEMPKPALPSAGKRKADAGSSALEIKSQKKKGGGAKSSGSAAEHGEVEESVPEEDVGKAKKGRTDGKEAKAAEKAAAAAAEATAKAEKAAAAKAAKEAATAKAEKAKAAKEAATKAKAEKAAAAKPAPKVKGAKKDSEATGAKSKTAGHGKAAKRIPMEEDSDEDGVEDEECMPVELVGVAARPQEAKEEEVPGLHGPTSPGPHVTLVLNSPGPYVTIAWQAGGGGGE